jgi:hypothetical protein
VRRVPATPVFKGVHTDTPPGWSVHVLYADQLPSAVPIRVDPGRVRSLWTSTAPMSVPPAGCIGQSGAIIVGDRCAHFGRPPLNLTVRPLRPPPFVTLDVAHAVPFDNPVGHHTIIRAGTPYILTEWCARMLDSTNPGFLRGTAITDVASVCFTRVPIRVAYFTRRPFAPSDTTTAVTRIAPGICLTNAQSGLITSPCTPLSSRLLAAPSTTNPSVADDVVAAIVAAIAKMVDAVVTELTTIATSVADFYSSVLGDLLASDTFQIGLTALHYPLINVAGYFLTSADIIGWTTGFLVSVLESCVETANALTALYAAEDWIAARATLVATWTKDHVTAFARDSLAPAWAAVRGVIVAELTIMWNAAGSALRWLLFAFIDTQEWFARLYLDVALAVYDFLSGPLFRLTILPGVICPIVETLSLVVVSLIRLILDLALVAFLSLNAAGVLVDFVPPLCVFVLVYHRTRHFYFALTVTIITAVVTIAVHPLDVYSTGTSSSVASTESAESVGSAESAKTTQSAASHGSWGASGL